MYLPPLDPSSNSTSSSVSPNSRMMVQRCENRFKLRKLNDAIKEDNVMQSKSNITHENNLLSKPEAGLAPHTKEPTTEEKTRRLSAKSQLYNLCCLRHWQTPMYEYCSEGPCHMRLFTVKVTVEIKEDSRITVLECFGDPQHKKKIAAEQAAEAALWYFKNVGHTLQSEKPSGRQGQTKPI